MKKKYIILSNTRKIVDTENGTFYVRRIQACRDICNDNGEIIVEKGAIGGYIEDEKNLSHMNSCWVYDDAVVCNDASISDNVVVRNNAMVINSIIIGNSVICDNAKVVDSLMFIDAKVEKDEVLRGVASAGLGL